MIVLLASLAVTACNGGNGEDVESKDAPTTSQAAPKSSKHTHKWGDGVVTKPATCEEKGVKTYTCECGETKTEDIKALGHDYDEGVVTKEATCGEPGVKTYTCKTCKGTKTEEIKADHTWGEAVPVAGGEGEVDYNIFTCSVCSKKKIEFAAKNDKAVVDGSLKSDSQFKDYMKLGSNGNSVTYKFTSTVSGKATIYQRGVMDYWYDGNNNNEQRNYYSGKNSSDGNFELKVNDAVVDYSATKSLTYADMLPGEAQGSYSPLGDAIIGECNIVAGQNTVIYKRTESYNMLIKDFVIIFD